LEAENIEAQIVLCDDYAYIQALVSLADSQAELEDHAGALANYEEARKLAKNSGNSTAEKNIKLKTDEINSLLKSEAEAATAQEEAKAQKETEEKNSYAALVELDGDKAVTAESYDLALEYYNQAIDLEKETAAYEKATQVKTKIIEINVKVKEKDKEAQVVIADGYIKTGDNYMLDNMYDEAISSYKLGRDIYSLVKMPDKVAEVNEKISLANDNKKERENAIKLLEAEKVEAEGDELLQKNYFVQAKVKYQQAQILYQNINQLEKVLSVERKITTADEMIRALDTEAAAASRAAREDTGTEEE